MIGVRGPRASHASATALVIAGVLAAARTVEAEPCAPRAALAGDGEAVARVAAALHQLGVVTETEEAPRTGPAHCPVLVAAVELDRGGGIAVAVRDASHRSEGRVLSDPALAAAWIDSWLRDDFDAPALEVAAPAPHATDELTASARLEPEVSVFDRFALASSFEQAWTDDRSRWTGVSLSGCARLGALCVGARLRYATQDVTAALATAARTDISALATASWSSDVGRMSLAPELGVGVGRLTTERIDGCPPPPPMCPASDPTCGPAPACTSNPMRPFVGDGLHASSFTPRASASLRIAIPLFDHVWLDGLAGVTLAPFGHTGPYLPPLGAPLPPVPPQQLALPGEPTAALQLGVGLRVGAR